MSYLILAFSLFQWTTRVVMAAVILRRRMEPATSLAWLVVIFFIPLLGLGLYLLIGVNHLGRRRVKTHRRVVGASRSRARREEMRLHAQDPPLDSDQQAMIHQAQRISGNPIVGGNGVELVSDTNQYVERLVGDIDAAGDHVHLLYYIFRPDDAGRSVVEALLRARQRDVACRVLLDASGSRLFLRSADMQRLEHAGVQVHDMLPVSLWRRKLARIDLRNHRKIAIIDGHVAYAGSHNLVLADYGHPRAGKYIDLSARLTGPIVAQLQMVFLDDWVFQTEQQLDSPDLFPTLASCGQVTAQAVPTGANHEGETFRRVLLAALNCAQRKIIITTPYLVPDEPTTLALSMAVDRGVDVTIVVPLKGDHPIVGAAGRAYFPALLRDGIHIYRHQHGMLHAKTITVDDAFSLLGSANLDIRSFYLNFEINVLLYGKEITGQLRFSQQQYLSQAQQVDLESWSRRPAYKGYAEAAAALLSPLL
jgi:cardiolipin synthase